MARIVITLETQETGKVLTDQLQKAGLIQARSIGKSATSTPNVVLSVKDGKTDVDMKGVKLDSVYITD